jgi:hypothetical protein
MARMVLTAPTILSMRLVVRGRHLECLFFPHKDKKGHELSLTSACQTYKDIPAPP